ncbi:MAG: single-stranded-DNA-specific exonuclease RecJ [Ruminococcus sp.]|nr:single-stranded-DNA-specific exonuclease RecJ [Ruminococcus sp.]MCM1381947.1 single-stranded-DNA-specific exonuclease RecJ [Muribaculaceae bacterium]MCM1479357.1 single-stranded-DNA-specific exonuclease RecJ [Muribaculaceae bacterium]
MKKWTVGKPDQKAVAVLTSQGGLTEICAGVLVSRGIDAMDKALEFFNQGENGNALSDPFLIKDMENAANIITAAMDEGKKICVYGDYDCDGITATALLYSYLECMGADASYYINRRSEGYGLCADALRRLADEGAELIITVDNGISAVAEAELAKELGVELVITDHHKPGEVLPDAAAVVDPHRADDLSPFKDLCGCGVALKLIAAMDGGDCSATMEQFSDLAAIATIADIVPLKGENREIARQGLHYLENTENAGLKALMAVASVKPPISSVTAAFSLAPRLNASGRFGSARDAVELLLCEDENSAEEMANRLNALNNERKKTENEIMSVIEAHINENPEILYKRIIFLYGEGWHHGVIGIVASKIVERFGKPVFILSDDGDFARGSARSVEGFSIHKALTACAEHLTKFGGHSGAGGFSLKKENIDNFNQALQRYAKEEFPIMPMREIHADKILQPAELTVESVRSLETLEPCGEGNPSPLFAMPGVRVLEVVPLSGGAHTKLKLTYGSVGVYGLMFGVKTADVPYRDGDMIDLLAVPTLNTYNGQTSVNIRIADHRKSGVQQNQYFAAKDAYERYKRGEGAEERLIPRIVPTREDLAAVYRAVQKNAPADFDSLYFAAQSESINYCKFRLALDIFWELGLLEINSYNETAMCKAVAQKADLETSEILKGLRALAAK